jgi:PAS domain S-box-containing protein
MEQMSQQPMHDPPHPGLEALDDGFLMTDAEWRVTYWNRAAEDIFGAVRERVLGSDLWSTLPSLNESPAADLLRRVRESGDAAECADPFPGVIAEIQSMRVTPLAGGGVAVQVRRSPAPLTPPATSEDLLEAMRDGFVAVDSEWRIRYMNGVAEALTGLTRERAVGGSIWAGIPRRPREIGEAMRAAMQERKKRYLRGVRPRGRMYRDRVFDLLISPLPSGGLAVVFPDVTERVVRERQFARLAAESEEANRAKSRFFAAVSHELRTPLNAIVGYGHLLSSEAYGELPAGARRAADRIGLCAEHLSQLVDDLLLLTSTEIGKVPVSPAPVSLKEYLAAVSRLHRHQAEAKGLAFEVVAAGSLTIETDADRLRQLLNALLSNAVKFTSRGGVVVEAREVERWVELSVRDTGPGIAPAEQQRVFEAFERLSDAARSNPLANGAGLGLTVALHLARLLRGSLEVDPSITEGTRVVLTMPRTYPGS